VPTNGKTCSSCWRQLTYSGIDLSIKSYPLLLTLATLCLSLTATFGAWSTAHQVAVHAGFLEFQLEVRQAVRRIEQRMATYEEAERSSQAFLLGSMDVKREDFRLFVRGLQLQEKFPGIQGIALVKLLRPSQLAQHITAMRRQGLPGYDVTPKGEREIYSSITQIEPYAGLNLRALGFDMLSEPNRRAAMERARDTGQAAASGKVRLIQEDGRNVQTGLVMYLPVYRRDMPTLSVEQRRQNLVGWVGAPFRMDDLMAGLRGERSRNVALSIYDGEVVSEANKLYASSVPASSTSTLHDIRHILVAGRPWTLDIRPSAVLEQRLDNGRPWLIAIVGSILSVVLSLVVWLLASGRRIAMAIATQMTHQLSESEFRWKYALEGAGDGVFDWNSATGKVVYSERWKAMLGYAGGEIGNDADEWQRRLHPDDVSMVEACVRRYLDSETESLQMEFRMRCKDGSWKWILARAMAVSRTADGKPLRTIGTHTDITRTKGDEQALVEANAKLAKERNRARVILENSHDAFVTVLRDGTVRDWNTKAEKLFGWSADEAIGKDLATLIIPEAYRAVHNAGFARFAHDGTPRIIQNVVEVEALHCTGRHIPVELAVAGVPDGEHYVVAAFIRDISERKAAQRRDAERSQALEDARNALQHAQKLEAVGKLTGGIAHDFNNVLQVIMGNVQLLERVTSDNGALQQRLGSIKSATQRGATLSAQLLAFARRQPLRPVSTNLVQLIESMQVLLQRAVGEAVRLQFVWDTTLWNTLIDPGQFENVLLNLAINARDAMEGRGELTIGVRNLLLGEGEIQSLPGLVAGEYVLLSLTDAGAGMTPEVMAQAFEPFFTTKQVGQGTGLGLSMAYGVIKQSGGEIKLNSKIGQGTTVMIYLPRSRQPENIPSSSTIGLDARGTETILVVEDDEEVRTSVVANLIDLGYKVLQASDGERALAVLKDSPRIDLLFSDVVMPGPLTGFELAVKARVLHPGLPVLFTSGYPRDELTTDGRLKEGVSLLSKPYDRHELARRIRESLAT
jgi:PAS domain S-box-containing protein